MRVRWALLGAALSTLLAVRTLRASHIEPPTMNIAARRKLTRASIILAMIGALLLPRAIARAQDPLDDLQPIPYQVGSVTDQSDPRWNKTRIGLTVAKVLEPDELRNYALTLHLSAAQRASVREAYLVYRAKIDKLNAEYQEPMASLSTEAAEAQDNYDLAFLRLLTELRALESKYQRDLVAYDKALLTDMQAVLSEPQQPLFERVALRRARKRCTPYTIHISQGHIDFVELVEKYVTDIDVRGDLDPLLREYERLITPLYLQIDESARGIGLDDTRELVMSKYAADGKTPLAPGSPEAKASSQAYFQERRPEILGRTIPQQERLAGINRQYIEKLKAAIPADQFAPLWAEYLRLSFPYIHPDRCEPTEEMQSMLDAKGLDPDLRTMMQARMEAWRAAYDAMTRDMEEHYIAYNKYFARHFSSEREHTPIIRKLRLDRMSLSEEAVKSLHAMMPVELKTKFDKSVSLFQQRMANYRQEETNPRRGNP